MKRQRQRMADVKSELDISLETLQEKMIALCDCDDRTDRYLLSEGIMNDIGKLIVLIG